MQVVFKSKLEDSDISKIKVFCDSVDYFAIEQAIGFTELLYNARITYFYLIEQDVIKSFCKINENFRFAHIWFGPVCDDRELMIKSINEIIKFYKKRCFWYLGIQMYKKSGYDTDYIEYALSKSHIINYVFNNENTKSSLEIDLERNMEDLYRNIRKGHKSDIKKAIKSGMRVEELRDGSELSSFISVYLKMCKARMMGGHSANEIEGICNYLIQHKKGQILLAKDANNIVVGGAILVFQGVSVRYLISASDPDRRDLPMTHLVIYMALKSAKTDNFKYFDFWGYNHFAEKDNQIFNINSFKKGFGGYYTFLAKKMNVSLIPFGFRLYRLSVYIKKLKQKL